LNTGAGPSHHNQLTNADITSLFNQPSSQSPQVFSPPPQSLFNSPPPTQKPVQPVQKVDPFASINSSQASRTASPFQFQTSAPATSTLAAKPPQPPTNMPAAQPQSSLIDDEWNFASALPPAGPTTFTITNSSINITWELSRDPADHISIKQTISNNTPAQVTGLTFQVAVTKVSDIIPSRKHPQLTQLSAISLGIATPIIARSCTTSEERHYPVNNYPGCPERSREQCENEVEGWIFLGWSASRRVGSPRWTARQCLSAGWK